MKRFLIFLATACLLAGCSGSKGPEPQGRWSAERANEWYSQIGWRSGCNYIPATAINQIEMWQGATFDPETIDKELGWAEELGFNTMRVFLSSVVWNAEPETFKDNINEFLDICVKHGIKPLFVFFDDCHQPESAFGPQPEPRPGIHNSGWVKDPSISLRSDPEGLFPILKAYVQDILTSFKDDDRILLWDLFNEPSDQGPDDCTFELLQKVFEWAREVAPSQPLTSGIFSPDQEKYNEFQLANSDIISYHNYSDGERQAEIIADLAAQGRPIFCTEYMARTRNSTFQNSLPTFKDLNVSAINWGFVAGKTGTIYPWGNPENDGSEPEVWFHDILRTDKTPFDQEEIDVIKYVNSDEYKPGTMSEADSPQKKMFDDGNYALFMHFGLYSYLEGVWKDKTYFGNAEWIMNPAQAGIPVEEYMPLAKEFNPSDFDAEAIAQLALDAGMKYIVITSKHHEGFAMFDSDACDFNIHDASPCGRDLIGELADACHRHGLGIGFYYSQFQDWTAPGGGGGGPRTDASGREISFDEYFRTKCVPQVKELLTKYGDLELIWFDTPGDMGVEYSKELVDLVHELQPGCLVSSRVGNGMGDYESLGDMQVPVENMPGRWEGIDVTQVGWGYSRNDHEFKSPEYIVEHLTTIVARGGTYMMNVGPTSKGVIAPGVAQALRSAGKWVHRYPDAVYGAGPSPWKHALPWGDAVTQPGKVYLIVYDWPADGKLWVPGILSELKSARLYDGRKLKFSKTDDGWTCISVPAQQPDEIASVIELEMPGTIMISSATGIDPGVPTTISMEAGEHDCVSYGNDDWMDKFGEWKFKIAASNFTDESWFDWTVCVQNPGTYDVELEYKGGDSVLWQLEDNGEPVIINDQAAGNTYSWHRLGWVDIKEPGKHCFCVRALDGDRANVKVTAIRFTPVKF